MKFKKNSGSSLIEVLVVATILSVVSLTFLGSFAIISRFHEKNMYIIKSQLLAEEGMEALRLIKSNNWNIFTMGVKDQYLSVASSTWMTTTTPEIIDGIFYRRFFASTVGRDANGDIVQNGGSADPNIYKVYVQVDWKWRDATTSARYYSYMTNL
jgi:Tfp pilus assembly protein PilV